MFSHPSGAAIERRDDQAFHTRVLSGRSWAWWTQPTGTFCSPEQYQATAAEAACLALGIELKWHLTSHQYRYKVGDLAYFGTASTCEVVALRALHTEYRARVSFDRAVLGGS